MTGTDLWTSSSSSYYMEKTDCLSHWKLPGETEYNRRVLWTSQLSDLSKKKKKSWRSFYVFDVYLSETQGVSEGKYFTVVIN